MEDKKSKHTPAPGIPEALHPPIGNGVAWEKNVHEFLLKHPDASKQLEWRLQPDQIIPVETPIQPLTSIESIDKPDLLLEESTPIASITTGQPVNSQDALDISTVEVSPQLKEDDSSEVPEQSDPVKPRRKKKPSKEEKSTQSSESSEEPKLQKPQKAGKLIKKAAKTVKRQEAEKNLAESPAIILREITLSPYTNWLKGLAGSEYVHPYDEDYAFNQGVDPSSGGISETFADLLANQGYKDQAIEMYMRLMEKYPEKSSFFAAKIEALQQQ